MRKDDEEEDSHQHTSYSNGYEQSKRRKVSEKSENRERALYLTQLVSCSHTHLAPNARRRCIDPTYAWSALYPLASTRRWTAHKTAYKGISRSQDIPLVRSVGSQSLAATCILINVSSPSAFNVFDGTLYCSQCDQIVSDPHFEIIANREKNMSRNKSDRSTSSKLSEEMIDDVGPSICRGEYRRYIDARDKTKLITALQHQGDSTILAPHAS